MDHPQRTSTVLQETMDDAHEKTYVFTVRLKNRGINPDQREALAKLVRLRAREVAVFAELIAGKTEVKEASLRYISTAEGVFGVDFFGEQLDDDPR